MTEEALFLNGYYLISTLLLCWGILVKFSERISHEQ